MIFGRLLSHKSLVVSFLFTTFLLFSPEKNRLVLGETTDNFFNFQPIDQPVVENDKIDDLSALSYVVVDIDSGSVLLSKNENVSLPPASVTKIMTALVAADYYSKKDVVEVKSDYPIGRNMGLKKGEQFTVFDLYLGLLVHSANDAAFVLADNYPGGVDSFIEAMNNKASLLGLSRTHFTNFAGEEDLDHFTTALDIAKLSRLFLKNELFSTIVELDSAVVRSVDGIGEHQLETTNQLLGVVPEIKGLKTGWTNQAGECFVSYFQLEEEGKTRRLVAVILASNDRFGETKRLLEWVKNNVFWRSVADPLS
jgi:serine-type D-Ala-D-Ala carboxypeptidase (penicillin-binding protein 5/6)